AGSGLAGLLAAAAASSEFDEVLVLDPRDAHEPATSAQASQLHNVLTRGQIHLEELFPGFRAHLLDAVRAEGSVADETRVYEFGGRAVERPLGMSIWSASWHLLWTTARALLPGNVQLLGGTALQAVVTGGGTVEQVVVKRADETSTLSSDGL